MPESNLPAYYSLVYNTSPHRYKTGNDSALHLVTVTYSAQIPVTFDIKLALLHLMTLLMQYTSTPTLVD